MKEFSYSCLIAGIFTCIVWTIINFAYSSPCVPDKVSGSIPVTGLAKGYSRYVRQEKVTTLPDPVGGKFVYSEGDVEMKQVVVQNDMWILKVHNPKIGSGNREPATFPEGDYVINMEKVK